MAGRRRKKSRGGRGAAWVVVAGAALAVAAVLLLRPLPPAHPRERAEAAAPAGQPALAAPPAAAPPVSPPAPPRAAERAPQPAAVRHAEPRPAQGPPASDASPGAAARAAAKSALPAVAIVIDDCGQSLELMQRASRLSVPLTFAVIPWLPHSRESAEAAWNAGHQVILHQPMEPESADEDPGEGVLRTGMSGSQVRKTLRANLGSIPHVAGLNNHMGSRATADPVLMGLVLAEVRSLRRDHPGLFFLDSRTTPATVAFEAARHAGVPAAQRKTFLDNDESPVAIHEKLAELVAAAVQDGEAVGIGHLKPATIGVLEAELPGLSGQEVRFVLLGDIVR